MSAAPPLQGVRVLDLSRVLAGPFCTQLLADLGADVVKVERPGGGDETRTWGPPFAGGESTYFMSANRGKRSIAVDMADPRGRDVVLRLAATADIAIENFREGGADRLGVGYEALSAVRPGIVYGSIEGYGGGREPSGRPGYDFVIQAESGLMAITGPADGEPSKAGVALVDVICGLHLATGVLAAHARQARTGEGEHVRVSLLDAALASLVNVAAAALVTRTEPRRHGNAHPSIAPYQTLRAADGELALAAPNDPMFRRVCEIVGAPELADDPRFASNADRVANREALVEALEARLAARPAQEWIDELLARGVPAGKVRGVLDAFDAAAASGRPATVRVDHPLAGEVDLPAGAIRLDGTATQAPVAPPLLGQHTREVLAAAGLGETELDTLERDGVVARATPAGRSPG